MQNINISTFCLGNLAPKKKCCVKMPQIYEKRPKIRLRLAKLESALKNLHQNIPTIFVSGSSLFFKISSCIPDSLMHKRLCAWNWFRVKIVCIWYCCVKHAQQRLLVYCGMCTGSIRKRCVCWYIILVYWYLVHVAGIHGCISCGILVSGIRARGVSSEHMENMKMFSCSPT